MNEPERFSKKDIKDLFNSLSKISKRLTQENQIKNTTLLEKITKIQYTLLEPLQNTDHVPEEAKIIFTHNKEFITDLKNAREIISSHQPKETDPTEKINSLFTNTNRPPARDSIIPNPPSPNSSSETEVQKYRAPNSAQEITTQQEIATTDTKQPPKRKNKTVRFADNLRPADSITPRPPTQPRPSSARNINMSKYRAPDSAQEIATTYTKQQPQEKRAGRNIRVINDLSASNPPNPLLKSESFSNPSQQKNETFFLTTTPRPPEQPRPSGASETEVAYRSSSHQQHNTKPLLKSESFSNPSQQKNGTFVPTTVRNIITITRKKKDKSRENIR